MPTNLPLSGIAQKVSQHYTTRNKQISGAKHLHTPKYNMTKFITIKLLTLILYIIRLIMLITAK